MRSLAHHLADLALIFGGYVAVMNWASIFLSRKGRFVSSVPFIGALFLAIGLATYPQTRPYAWTAVLIDYGTLISPIGFYILFYEAWITAPFNLIHRFSGFDSRRRVELRLLKNGQYRGEVEFPKGVPIGEPNAFYTRVGLGGTWSEVPDGFLLCSNAGSRVIRLQREGELFRSIEHDSHDTLERPLESFEGLNFKHTP